MRFLYARTAEGGKQMNQTALKSLVKQICESTSSSQYVRLRYLDELYTEIEAVSGLSIECILALLRAGYTLKKPCSSSMADLMKETNPLLQVKTADVIVGSTGYNTLDAIKRLFRRKRK